MLKISTKNVAQAIHALIKNKRGSALDQALTNAVEFLAKKNLLSKSKEILQSLEHLIDEDSGIVRAKVESPRELALNTLRELKTLLKKRYKAEDIILDTAEDASLIGGVRIEAKGEVIDLSLKNRVGQLQNYLQTN